MIPKLALPAPAKINLGLCVVDRRSDGYHNINTLYQFLSLHDTLEFLRLPLGTGLQVHSPIAPAENDLVLRAAELFFSRHGAWRDMRITVHKRIPEGGGLGGGSSDAATTLLGLNFLSQAGMSLDELASMGAQLGADVPVFVYGHAAYAQGVGDVLTPCEPPTGTLLLVHPGVAVSTARMFANSNLTLRPQGVRMAQLLQHRGNDFAPLARACHAEIDRAWRWLEQYAQPHLSGTGSCLYAQLDAGTANRLLWQLPAGCRGWVSESRNRSMLHEQLQMIGV